MDEYNEGFEQMCRSFRLKSMFRADPGDSSFQEYRKIYTPNPSFQPDRFPDSVEAFLKSTSNDLRESLNSQGTSTRFTNNLSPQQRRTIRALRENKELFFAPADKNLGPCIMLLSDYIKFCVTHLRDTSTYSVVEHDPRAELRQAVIEFHKKLLQAAESLGVPPKSLDIITDDLENKRLPHFYGMPKLHKPTIQPRPIVSLCGSILHGLSRWAAFHLRQKVESTTTYLASSTSLVGKLAQIRRKEHYIMFSYDADSLYTSIPLEPALYAVDHFFRGHPLREFLIEALRIVNSKNYFSFGDLTFLQLTGTAMGTPAACDYATLYLAYHEEIFIIPEFRDFIVLLSRFIDDGFGIWDPLAKPDAPFELQRFKAKLHTIPGVTWKLVIANPNISFMDLEVFPMSITYGTKSFFKPLNLYLFLPPGSAHPPGLLKGHIFGAIKKYHQHNTLFEDFKECAINLFQHLMARGHTKLVLKSLFAQALHKYCPNVDVFDSGVPVAHARARALPRATTPSNDTQILYKVRYDPNGPTRRTLREMLHAGELEATMRAWVPQPRVTICYKKSKSLQHHLGSMKLPADTPVSAVMEQGVSPSFELRRRQKGQHS